MPNSHASSPPRRFVVSAEQMLDWLATAVDSTGQPFQDTYGIDDSFRCDGDDLPDRIQILVSQAHNDGVLAIADHHLELWQVADEGFLLTLDLPNPPRLCSHHLSIADLVPEKTSGAVATFAVLDATARVANQLMDEHDRAAGRARTAPARLIPGPAPLGPPTGVYPTNPPSAGRPHRR
jgi:hypothetical protein